jgi:hypothetical protein
MKPGRYIVIGKLYLPITNDPPDIYKIGLDARRARIELCRNHGLPRRMSNFERIWNILNKE